MTEEQILNYLDQCHFPRLDNGYYYHADQELRIYRSRKKWAIVMQVIQYNNHCLDINGFSTIVYKYGSDIEPEKSLTNNSFFHLAEDGNAETFLKENDIFDSYLNPVANYCKINQTSIPIEHDRAKYFEKGIKLESDKKIKPWEVLRYLTPKFSDNFWVGRGQLEIDSDLKEVIKFSEWEHPDNIDTVLSDMNSFKEIARCLANNLAFDRNRIE